MVTINCNAQNNQQHRNHCCCVHERVQVRILCLQLAGIYIHVHVYMHHSLLWKSTRLISNSSKLNYEYNIIHKDLYMVLFTMPTCTTRYLLFIYVDGAGFVKNVKNFRFGNVVLEVFVKTVKFLEPCEQLQQQKH